MIGIFCCTSTRTAIGDSLLDLVRYASRKDDIVIIKGEPYAESEFDLPSDHILTLPFSKSDLRTYFRPSSWRRLGGFLRGHGVDRLLIYSTVPVNWGVSRFLGKRSVFFWIHDPVPHPGEPKLKKFVQDWDRRRLMKSNRIAGVLVGSRYLTRLVAEVAGVDPAIIHSIPLPWQTEIVSRGEQIAWDERRFDLIFWGRIEAYKGLDVFSSALDQLMNEDRDLRVLIAGSGPMEKYLSPAVMDSGNIEIDNRYIPDEELGPLISDSRIAVFPYSASTGTMIAQTALAMGCRVIASDVGSFPEYLTVDEERVGTLVPPGDTRALVTAIREALLEDRDHEHSSERAREVFSPENWVAEIEKIVRGSRPIAPAE